MINPSKIERAKGSVISIVGETVTVRMDSGHIVQGWPPKANKLRPHMKVTIQCSFSIVLDRYVIKTCNPKKAKE